MSGVLEQLKQVATIEGIESEQQRLREQIVEMQKQIDGLELFRKALVTARDGKPAKVPRAARKQAEQTVEESDESEREDVSQKVVTPELNESMSLREKIIASLKANPNGLNISQLLSMVGGSYQSIYANLNNGTGPEHFEKQGAVYWLRKAY